MKGSGEEAKPEAVPQAACKKTITVSARKVAANRKNALKSTGPKTLRGKTYSARNAIKHGLFSGQTMDFISHGEDPTEYGEVLNGLRVQYQPIGTAEELEVERLALCWWRLKRAWRYENATNRVALRDFGRRELAEQAEWCKERDKEEEAIILQLQSAEKEIEATGEISQELKQRIFAMDPWFESIWKAIELVAQQRLKEPTISKMFRKLKPRERSSVLASHIVTNGIGLLEELAQSRAAAVHEIAVAQHVIPKGEALDKILRYEAAIERQLGRTVDRLERLQRRRQGEMIPPPVSVHLTR
jgi:hypothetical protein